MPRVGHLCRQNDYLQCKKKLVLKKRNIHIPVLSIGRVLNRCGKHKFSMFGETVQCVLFKTVVCLCFFLKAGRGGDGVMFCPSLTDSSCFFVFSFCFPINRFLYAWFFSYYNKRLELGHYGKCCSSLNWFPLL